MSSREDILQSIRRNTRVRYEKPDLSALEHEALTYEDKLSKFCEVIKQVGGQAVILKDKENVNDVIKAAYPDAKRIASTIKEIKTGNTVQPITCSTFHPDDVEESGNLDGTDVAIVDGRIGVCENGAVWLTQDVEQRAVYFISEALVIILDRNNLVNNMHEAYRYRRIWLWRIHFWPFEDSRYRTGACYGGTRSPQCYGNSDLTVLFLT